MSKTKDHENYLVLVEATSYNVFFPLQVGGIVMLWSVFFYLNFLVMFLLFSHVFILMVFLCGSLCWVTPWGSSVFNFLNYSFSSHIFSSSWFFFAVFVLGNTLGRGLYQKHVLPCHQLSYTG
jgi:hypothetical protein